MIPLTARARRSQQQQVSFYRKIDSPSFPLFVVVTSALSVPRARAFFAFGRGRSFGRSVGVRERV